MSEWKKYKLGDLGLLQRGRSRHRPRYAFHLYGGDYPFIQTGDVRESSKYITKYEQAYSEAGLAQSKLWKKGTLCITIAANIAELGILTFDACFPDSVLGFTPNEKITNIDFVYYTLLHFQRELKHIGEGSVQDNINLGTFEDILFPMPSIAEQERIAGILSSLDNKIDLLTRQNATLEAMTETLFRQYFIENHKEDWKDGVIADIAKHSKTTIHPQKQPAELFYHYSIPSFDNTKTPTLDLGVEIQSNKYKVPNNSILFSKLNPHKDKRVWLLLNSVHDNSVCSTEFQIIEPINKEYLCFVYGWLTHSENYNDIASGVGGTSGSHQRIDPATIFSFVCPIIDIDYIRLYNSQAKPLFEKQINNQEQIRSLTKLRDTLLPKLMNNEIKI